MAGVDQRRRFESECGEGGERAHESSQHDDFRMGRDELLLLGKNEYQTEKKTPDHIHRKRAQREFALPELILNKRRDSESAERTESPGGGNPCEKFYAHDLPWTVTIPYPTREDFVQEQLLAEPVGES